MLVMNEEHHKSPGDSNEKTNLECEKLRAEIDAIRRPLIRTPGFYAAISPVALAFLGLVFTWATGWFDVQRTRLSNEKTLLEAQTERLKTERTTLEALTRDQQKRVARADEEIEKLRQRESYLTNQVAQLDEEREELRLAKELLEKEARRLAGSDNKASQFLEQLSSLQATRERLVDELGLLQASNATLRTTAILHAALIRRANDVLSEGWSFALKDKATWEKFREFGGHVLDVHLASMGFLPEWQLEPDPQRISNKRTVRTYDDDLQTESGRVWRIAIHKSLADYIREAEERKLLSRIVPQN